MHSLFLLSSSPLLLQAPTLAVHATAVATTFTIKDFFINVFTHPAQNMYAIVAFGAVTMAFILGAVYLVKYLYEKKCAPQG